MLRASYCYKATSIYNLVIGSKDKKIQSKPNTKEKNCLLAPVFSLVYFLYTVCHGGHLNEKDTSPLLKCFEV